MANLKKTLDEHEQLEGKRERDALLCCSLSCSLKWILCLFSCIFYTKLCLYVSYFSFLQSFHHGQHSGLDEDGSIYVNEAAFLASSMNNRHLHHYQHQCQHNTHPNPGYVNSPSAQNSLNSLLALSNHTHPTISMQDELWTEGTEKHKSIN